MKTYTIRLTSDHVTIDGRTHAAGDVVEVDKHRRKALVEHGHAVDQADTAAAPPPVAVGRRARFEKAVR